MRKTSNHFPFFISPLSFQKGFTLVEIVTVMSLLAVIGAITVGVITITLRASKKSDTLEIARQEGDTTLTRMVKNIRYAQSLILPNGQTCVPKSPPLDTITITSITTHAQTIYSCDASANTIDENSVSLFNTNVISVQPGSCSFVCTQPTLGDPPTITIQYTLIPTSSSGIFYETNFSLPFQSSVTMRNLQ